MSTSSSSSSEKKATTKKTVTPSKTEKVVAKTPVVAKKIEISSSGSSSSSVEKPKQIPTKVVPTPKAETKGKPTTTPQKVDSKVKPTTPSAKKESSSGSGSSSSEKKTKVTKATTPVVKTPVEKNTTKVTPPVTAVAKKKKESSSGSSSSSEKPVVTKSTPAVKQPVTKTVAAKKSSSSSSSSVKKVVPVEKKKKSSGSSSSSEMHIVKPAGKDVNMTDASSSKRKFDNDDGSAKKRKIDTNGGGGVNTKIRLGNLSFDLDGKDDEIKTKFESYGPVKHVEMIARKDGKFAGVAIIEFETVDAATSSLALNDEDFYGRKMKVTFSTEDKQSGGKSNRPPTPKPDGCTTVFIGNLSFNVTEDEVYEFFKDCGEIKELRWPKGDFTGIGWVEFWETASTDSAIKKAGYQLAGREIRVDYAAPRAPRAF